MKEKSVNLSQEDINNIAEFFALLIETYQELSKEEKIRIMGKDFVERHSKV